MNYYDEIKNKLIDNELVKIAKDYSKNSNDLNTYYKIGKILYENKIPYGEYIDMLKRDIGKVYTVNMMKKIIAFYTFIKKGMILSNLCTWSHYIELLKLKDITEINYYINISIKEEMSVRELRNKVKNNSYKRITNDMKDKLTKEEKTKIGDLIKNKSLTNSLDYTKYKEKLLKKIVLENLDSFIKKLGNKFSYICNNYEIKIDNKTNYIDLLLFNIEYNSYVVVELKEKISKEYIYQIQLYMDYIDKNIKTVNQNNTIGMIIYKEDSMYVVEYCSDDRIKKQCII